MIKRITTEDNEEFLRQASLDVDLNKDNVKDYIETIKKFCQNSELYALAPVQIGIPKRIIYIRNTTPDMTKNNDTNYNEEVVYINPTIINMYGHTQFLEGCGSCKYADNKYIACIIDRPYKIEIEYFDITGNKNHKTIEGFESTIFCHEYDHLNGILHMDRNNESSLMTLEEMKKFRINNPYKIISKEEEFSYNAINKRS